MRKTVRGVRHNSCPAPLFYFGSPRSTDLWVEAVQLKSGFTNKLNARPFDKTAPKNLKNRAFCGIIKWNKQRADDHSGYAMI